MDYFYAVFYFCEVKMKITETRKTEMLIISLYQLSLQSDGSEEIKKSKKVIALVCFVLKLLSIFTDENHLQIVDRLYFSKNNIVKIGIKSASEKVYMSERTLYFYRRKYCEIINIVLDEFHVLSGLFLS